MVGPLRRSSISFRCFGSKSLSICKSSTPGATNCCSRVLCEGTLLFICARLEPGATTCCSRVTSHCPLTPPPGAANCCSREGGYNSSTGVSCPTVVFLYIVTVSEDIFIYYTHNTHLFDPSVSTLAAHTLSEFENLFFGSKI